jgi:hypothetical protein
VESLILSLSLPLSLISISRVHQSLASGGESEGRFEFCVQWKLPNAFGANHPHFNTQTHSRLPAITLLRLLPPTEPAS